MYQMNKASYNSARVDWVKEVRVDGMTDEYLAVVTKYSEEAHNFIFGSLPALCKPKVKSY